MAASRPAMPDLPGLTWDEERNRYIKILADRHARALGAAAKTASASAVRDAQAFKKRRREEEVQAASVAKVQVQRSRVHKHAIVGMTLGREAGILRKAFPDTRGDVWANLIEPGWTAPVSCNSKDWYMMAKTAQNDAFMGIINDRDTTSCQSSRLGIIFTDTSRGSRLRCSEDSFGRVSSMSLTEKFVFVTTFQRQEPNRLFEISRGDSEQTGKSGLLAALLQQALTLSSAEVPRISYSISKADTRHDYWCASFHPDGSRPRIAVGSEHSILIHNPFCSHGHGLVEYKRPISSAPARCIRWKSEHVIAAAFQDATVHLYDVRAREDVLRLRHSQSVMRMHCPDENKILLGGPKQLSMYDLRYSKPPSNKHQPSRPWLHYYNYDNTSCNANANDMDISPRLGLLALALEATTEIWNLWTGEKLCELRTPDVPRNSVDKSHIISFTRPYRWPYFLDDCDDPTGLLVAGQHTALEWRLDADASDKPPKVMYNNMI